MINEPVCGLASGCCGLVDREIEGCWTLMVCVLVGCWILELVECVLELSCWDTTPCVDVRAFSETKGGPPVSSISASLWLNLTAEAE